VQILSECLSPALSMQCRGPGRGRILRQIFPMRLMKWIGIAAALLLTTACFMTWVIIPSKNIVVSGIDSTGTNFGKPGYIHFITTFFFIVFSLIPRVWAKRANLLVTALNMAWAVRNYFLVTICRGGECPEKHMAVYIILLASVLMLVSSMLPDGNSARKAGNTSF